MGRLFGNHHYVYVLLTKPLLRVLNQLRMFISHHTFVFALPPDAHSSLLFQVLHGACVTRIGRKRGLMGNSQITSQLRNNRTATPQNGRKLPACVRTAVWPQSCKRMSNCVSGKYRRRVSYGKRRRPSRTRINRPLDSPAFVDALLWRCADNVALSLFLSLIMDKLHVVFFNN